MIKFPFEHNIVPYKKINLTARWLSVTKLKEKLKVQRKMSRSLTTKKKSK